MTQIPAEYVLSGDARQLLQTLDEVAKAFRKAEDSAKKTGDEVGTKLPAKTKPAATAFDRLKAGMRAMGGETGAAAGKLEQLGKATAGLSTETLAAGAAVAGAVAFVAALAAAYVALGAAIAKTVLASAEWDDQLGALSPLTETQTKAVHGAADAYDLLGTQAKITGTRIGGEFADEVKAGINVLNGIMAAADAVVSALSPVGSLAIRAAEGISYLTPAGNLARVALHSLAEEGEGVQEALNVATALSATLKKLDEDERKRREQGFDPKETGSVDGILAAEEAAQKADEKAKKRADDKAEAEHAAHAQYIEDLQERRAEERQARSYEEQQEQAKLDAIDEEEKKRDGLQKKRLAYEKKIAAEQKKNHDDELQRIEATAQTILSLASQIADLVNAIADAVGGEGKGSEKRKKWTQRILGGLEVAAGVAVTAAGGGAVGVPLALSGGSSIASSFPSGGITYREAPGGMARTPDHFGVAVQSREAILNRAAVERLGETGVDALNRGGMPGGVQVIAMQYRHRVFNRFISDHLRRSGALSKAITNSKRRGHARGR